MMKTRFGLLFSLIMLALMGTAGIAAAAPNETQTGQAYNITTYNGPVGPGNALYGLKIAFENFDESFTFNQSEKLEKQVNHADLRLAELKHELTENRTDTADIALEQYRLKINQTEEVLEPLPVNGTGPAPAIDETGLLHAREMITKHQQVLEDLLQSHPNNTGLERAYENSIELEQKFEKKMENVRNNQKQTEQNRSFAPPGNQTLLENQTPKNPDRGMRPDGNVTVPADGNQSQDKNKFAGNTTRNTDQNMQGINQSLQDPNRQQGSNTPANDQPGKSGQSNTGDNKGNTQNGNANNNQNINNNANQNTRNNNNAINPASGGNDQNTNTNRNNGQMTGGTSSVNTRTTGR